MNTARISSSVQTITEHQAALSWLLEYGGELTGRSDAASVKVMLSFAGGIAGARGAERVLSACATLSLPELVSAAIRNCENTIALCTDAIREEVAQ